MLCKDMPFKYDFQVVTMAWFVVRDTETGNMSFWSQAHTKLLSIVSHNGLLALSVNLPVCRIEKVWISVSLLLTSVPVSTLLWFSDTGQDWWRSAAQHSHCSSFKLKALQARSLFGGCVASQPHADPLECARQTHADGLLLLSHPWKPIQKCFSNSGSHWDYDQFTRSTTSSVVLFVGSKAVTNESF